MLSVTQLLITLITTAYCARIREVTVTREVFYSKEVYTSRIVEPTRSDLIEPSFSRPLLTISVRESLLSMAKAGRSTAIRLIRLIDGRDEPDKTTSLFYAKFTAAYTNCTLDSELTLKKIYSEDCPVDPTREMILCSGYVESSGKRTGQRLHCEPAGSYEKSKISP
ncbi:hypothetical protein M514_10507 [Trichuris suis]|uniref:Secreted protein n=1 Tax=Trichuris suis TaxID=68888 RepID=A0A085LUK6_9BILA|nr:hypothetical protein M513_10507 [Trichuris suis]KFD62238.1 hypothetical protein M514_10507 [Trichuris suis]